MDYQFQSDAVILARQAMTPDPGRSGVPDHSHSFRHDHSARYGTVAIPKKGSRPIAVDGQDYRWFVRRKPTDCGGSGWTPLTVAVSSDVPRSSSLIATLATKRPDAWLHLGSTAVTPGDVAALIRLAIRRGWNPSKPGSAFQLDLRNDRQYEVGRPLADEAAVQTHGSGNGRDYGHK